MNTILNMKLSTFVNHFIPGTQNKIKIIKSFEIIFQGSIDELYYASPNVLNSTVNMVAADGDGYLCISCR